MSDFTASNGVIVREREGFLTVKYAPHGMNYIGNGIFGVALNEYMDHLRDRWRAEDDERLGRWRWPENPDYVVYADPAETFERMFGPGLDLVILRESDGMTKGYVRAEDQGGPPAAHRVEHILAARAFFDAHPEPKPEWHEAKPDEVWVLDASEFSGPHVVFEDGAFTPGIGFRHAVTNVRGPGLYASIIKSARRIWPES